MDNSKPLRQEKHPEKNITGVCVICTQLIHHDEASVMQKGQEICFVYGMCEACRVPHITVEIGTDQQTTSVSLLTDMKKSEVRRFWSRGSITADDVLSISEAVSNSKQFIQAIHKR